MTLEVNTEEDGKYIVGVAGMVGIQAGLIRTEAAGWMIAIEESEQGLLMGACRIAMKGEKNDARKAMLKEFCDQ